MKWTQKRAMLAKEKKWVDSYVHQKAPDNAGAFESLERSLDQYLPTSGPPQLKW
jgi:hypothetical protein